MEEQQRLSEAYSDLKVKYYDLKSECAIRGIANSNLAETNNKLLRKVQLLQEELEALKDSSVVQLPKNSSSANYVTFKRYRKQKELTDSFIALYHRERDKNKSICSQDH